MKDTMLAKAVSFLDSLPFLKLINPALVTGSLVLILFYFCFFFLFSFRSCISPIPPSLISFLLILIRPPPSRNSFGRNSYRDARCLKLSLS